MPRPLPLAALLTAGAGAAHLAAAVPHFASSPLYGTLFIAAGWLQMLLAAVLLASGRNGLIWAAIAVNTATMVSWALSRTVGLPLAHPEPVLMADALTVALEMAAVGVLVARLRGATFGFRGGQVTAPSLVTVLALTIGGSTVAIAGLGSGNHHAEASQQEESAEEGGHGPASDASSKPESHPSQRAANDGHEHDDGTVHVHEPGKPHMHPGRTVHVHPLSMSGPDDTAEAPDAGSEDDGHDHTGENSH